MNAGDIITQEDFNNRCRAAAFIGTIQAGYTDFHYLRDCWRETTEKEALIGVSMTGIASNGFMKNIDRQQGAEIILKENARIAKLIGINKAARTTCVKPEGTTSSVLGTSSGIHAWHSPFYIRRIIAGKNEAIYQYMNVNNPVLVEDDLVKSNQSLLKFPIKAPEGSVFRNESPFDLLERMKIIHEDWIRPGHRKGSNLNNVSITVSVKDDEWESVGKWMWENKDYYNGIAVIPYDNGSYNQAPFTECTEEEYNKLYSKIGNFDINQVSEVEDGTNQRGEIACAGGSCSLI
jgi:ribonucleoside-diphosphate reductase alpha chain